MKLLTGGTYDLFHWGHVEFLKKCKKIADYVVVAVNQDEFIVRYKHSPIMSTTERVSVLRACRYVDEVRINDLEPSWMGMVESVGPDIIAIGSDWVEKDYYNQMQISRTELEGMGIVLVYFDYTKDISSTMIRERMK
jgi:cytidyltransferase-like protein